MNKFLNDTQLHDMTVPTVELPQHKTQLKHALISAGLQRQKANHVTVEGWIDMSAQKNLLAGMGVVGIFALAVVAFSGLTPAKNVSAQEVARNAIAAVSKLTPDERKAAEDTENYKKHYDHATEMLQKAQKASDLRILSYAQVAKAYPQAEGLTPATGEPVRILSNPAGKEAPNLRELRYLVYTEGDKESGASWETIIGVDEDDIPQAILRHMVSVGSPKIGG